MPACLMKRATYSAISRRSGLFVISVVPEMILEGKKGFVPKVVPINIGMAYERRNIKVL